MAVISQYQVVIDGQTISASLWNGMEQNIIDNGLVPSGIEDYSSTDAQMQTTTDPFPSSTVSKPTSLQGELERMRYQLLQIVKVFDSTKTYWYEDLPTAGIITIDSTNTRLGVGTTSPSATIHADVSTGGTIRVSRSSISSEWMQLEHDGTNGTISTGSNNIYFSPGGSEVMRVESTGKVGIGETAPGAKVDINGDLILQNGAAVDEFSTDGTMAGNSDTAVPTEKAVKTYVDNTASTVFDSLSNVFATLSADVSGVATITTIDFTESIDTQSEYASGVFTASGAKIVILHARVVFASNTGSQNVFITVRDKTNAIVAQTYLNNLDGGGRVYTASVFYMGSLSSADELRVKVEPSSGTINILGGNGYTQLLINSVS